MTTAVVTTLPIVLCRRLDRDRVVTDPCPFCGLRHVHGEPVPGREDRLSHCSPGPRHEYRLLLVDPEPAPRQGAEHAH